MEDLGISKTRFYSLVQALEEAGKVAKSVSDEKWEKIQGASRNSNRENDQ